MLSNIIYIAANQYGGSGAMHSVSATTSSSTSITTSATASYSDIPNGVTSTSSSWDFFTALGLGPSIPTPVPGTGADAVHAALEGENESEFMLSGGAKNALVAVQRYYSNVSADFDRQQSIDLLLGIVSSTLPSYPSFHHYCCLLDAYVNTDLLSSVTTY